MTPATMTNAIGRAGMVATLRGFSPEADGRTVALRFSVGLMPAGEGAPPVLAWQALVLGEPLQDRERTLHEIVVADHCLVPVRQLTVLRVERLRKVRALRDFMQAMNELAQYLSDHPMTPEAAGQALAGTLQFTGIRMEHELLPVAVALHEAGFTPTEEGAMRMTARRAGHERAIEAIPQPAGGWLLTASADGAAVGETPLPPRAPRGEVVGALQRLRAAFNLTPAPAAAEAP